MPKMSKFISNSNLDSFQGKIGQKYSLQISDMQFFSWKAPKAKKTIPEFRGMSQNVNSLEKDLKYVNV